MIEVRRIRPDDGPLLRSARLAALADSPSAFGSTLDREEAFTVEQWRERATRGSTGCDAATWLALDSGAVVGIIGGYRPEPSVPAVDLVSMWVDPAARRTGAGRLLVDTVIGWAHDGGVESMSLWVTRGNDPAYRLYVSAGFAETGDVQPLPSDPCKDEIRMNLTL